MQDLTTQTQRIMRDAQSLLDDNKNGGRQRRVKTLGRGAKQLTMRHYMRKFTRILIAVFAIIVAATGAGIVMNGIGFTGVMATALAALTAVVFLAIFPRLKPPVLGDINRGSAAELVGRTQLWLGHQMPALPAPSAQLLGHMGMQLDGLGTQLAQIDGLHPQAAEVRKLIGEILPQTISAYQRIPIHLRGDRHAGITADAQLHQSLTNISREIDGLTRTLAEGSLDELAVKSQYIEYKYGAGVEPRTD